MEYKRLTAKIKNGDYGYYGKEAIFPLVGCELVDYEDGDLVQKLIDRLAELEDKIEKGTLIELPCKVGDTVYLIEMDWDEDCKSFYYITETDFMFQYLDYFGTYCFLTREEAEKRLKELQNG